MAMMEKNVCFKNDELEIELTSYINNKQNIWFRGEDVVKILGYIDMDKAIRNHVEPEDKKSFPAKTAGYSQRGPAVSFNK